MLCLLLLYFNFINNEVFCIQDLYTYLDSFQIAYACTVVILYRKLLNM
jgi:hypothetical protein